MLSINYSVLIIFIFNFVFVRNDPIDYSDCGSDYTVLEVDIEGCRVIPCKLEMGNYYKINMTLKPTFRSNSLTQEAYITLFDSIDITVDVVPYNPCESLICPVQISNGTKFQGKLFIGNNFVPAKGMLWWKMRTDTGRSAVCIKTTVRVEKKSSRFK